jgi:hypothetical protein
MKRGPKVGAPDHPYYRTRGVIHIAPEEADFVRRRIGGLLDGGAANVRLIDLLANAYVLGIKDAADVSNPRPVTRSEASGFDAKRAKF